MNSTNQPSDELSAAPINHGSDDLLSDDGPQHIGEILPAVLSRYDLCDTLAQPLPAAVAVDVFLSHAH